MTETYTKELDRPIGPIRVGARGAGVKRVQEWLCLKGIGTAIDGDFGPATEQAVRHWQEENHAPPTGEIAPPDWQALVGDLSAAMALGQVGQDLGQAIVAAATLHLGRRAREIGGDNRGPWVRHYCRGYEVAWCQGFASTVWLEAARARPDWSSPLELELDGVWCLYVPRMVTEARRRGLFVDGRTPDAAPTPGSMFFLRGGQAGYLHVGIVTERRGDTIATIEGNTNDDGSANGYEVARRIRKLASCDYAVLH